MTKFLQPSAYALQQIKQVPFEDRPLLICDVDEVLLQFIPQIEAFANEQDIGFKEHVYAFEGNLIELSTGADVSRDRIRRLIDDFFKAHVESQEPVTHAVEQLERLSQNYQIVILTNLPGLENHPKRTRLLQSYGINYPMVFNHGPKGPAVAALCANRSHQTTVFVDDSPLNMTSVNKHAPHVHLIHFIADSRFFEGSITLSQTTLKSNCWLEAGDFIHGLLR
ncbi:hypothetical protein [Flexibacterium corallicola]|uniref:hypothetical protein n=1 Tax=Flexibacterium corallicola TaxID=3037259 RepID=UPI00286F0F97|nr:hypothetical protein [Pseudovibrio sp. M1P-2-3]